MSLGSTVLEHARQAVASVIASAWESFPLGVCKAQLLTLRRSLFILDLLREALPDDLS